MFFFCCWKLYHSFIHSFQCEFSCVYFIIIFFMVNEKCILSLAYKYDLFFHFNKIHHGCVGRWAGRIRQLLILKSKIVSNEYLFASTAIHKNKSMCYAYILQKWHNIFGYSKCVYIIFQCYLSKSLKFQIKCTQFCHFSLHIYCVTLFTIFYSQLPHSSFSIYQK